MEIVIKCDNKINPAAADRDDVWFSAEVSGGIADGFVFSISKAGRVIYKKKIKSGFFPVLRPDIAFSENTRYHYEAIAYLGKNEVARSSGEFVTAFTPRKAKWVKAKNDDDFALVFSETFEVKKKEETYRAFICGLGFYDAYLNGAKVTDGYFLPLVSDYAERKNTDNPLIFKSEGYRVCANVYDVGNLIKDGSNRIEIVVGDGYYRNLDKTEEPFVSYGEKKAIFEIICGDGENAEIIAASDESARVKKRNAKSSLFNGDFVDFTDGEEGKEEKCVLSKEETGRFVFPALGADKIIREITPLKETREEGRIIYDFGYNHSGAPRFKVKGEKGKKLALNFAECLSENGELNPNTSLWSDYNEKLKTRHVIVQKSEYILSGGTDEIKPMFSWRCYRYLSAESDGNFEISGMKSLFISGDIRENMKFACSEEIFEEIAEKSVLTLKDNFRSGLLTDCPHREKRAYTGDGQIVCETVLYLFDGINFYSKWLDDIILSQREDGFIPYTVPCINGGGGYAWSFAVAKVPDELYRMTGDKEYIRKSFSAVERWVIYLYKELYGEKTNGGSGWLLGDWLSPEMSVFGARYMGTLCLYKACDLLVFFARELSVFEKEKTYSDLKRSVKNLINEEFFDKKRAIYSQGVQGENVIPLLLGIVPEEHKERVKKKIRETYEKNGYKFDTGIISTPLLIDCLCENGMEDIAYKLLTAEGFPSFKQMLSGETTLSEHWSKKWPDYRTGRGDEIVKGGGDISHCHPMFSSVVSRIIKYGAGLDLSELYKGNVIIAPKFSEIGKTSVEKQTLFGKIRVEITRDGKNTEIIAEIPSGLTADVRLKNAEDLSVNGLSVFCGAGETKNLKLPAGNYVFGYTEKNKNMQR